MQRSRRISSCIIPGGRSGGGRLAGAGAAGRTSSLSSASGFRQKVSRSRRETPFPDFDTRYHHGMIPERIRQFRDQYRAEEIGPRYSGLGHFLFTSSVCLGIIALAAAGVHHPTPLEWLTIPISFLFANLGEYFGHRYPMHHRTRGLGVIFKRHTLQHHHFFTDEAMSYDGWRDVKMVLFPPYLILFFFGGMGLPIGLALWAVATENVARLFVATIIGYFLTYEWLHFSYHLNPDSWIGRRAIIRVLRRHHTAHHDLAKMGDWNFNITFPICDAIFGTTAKR
jgi:hypothetical protein